MIALPPKQLLRLLEESLRIEGIHRPPTVFEIDATAEFLALKQPKIADVTRLVQVYVPGAILRSRLGLDIRLTKRTPLPGGLHIRERLKYLMCTLPSLHNDPWRWHVSYEILHPYTDGNGRSGRALWAWQMMRKQDGLPLGFLHQAYYQALDHHPG